MIHEQNVEYRHLNILRVAFLRELQENSGIVPAAKFRNMLKSVMRSVTAKLEEQFINEIKVENDSVSYAKLCDVINLYQYHLYIVKYDIAFLFCCILGTKQMMYRKKEEYHPRPKTRQTINVSKENEEMDNIIDYIWCRLSEKYIKMSKAFRNMDITIVLPPFRGNQYKQKIKTSERENKFP